MVIGAENTVCSVNDATWRVVAQRLIFHTVPNTLSSIKEKSDLKEGSQKQPLMQSRGRLELKTSSDNDFKFYSTDTRGYVPDVS